MNTTLRCLPIRVEPVDGETADGYASRLASAHLLNDADIRRLVLGHVSRTSWSPADPRVTGVLEAIAALPPGALRHDFDRDGMSVQCGHRSWRPQKCPKCRRFAAPRTACRTCAHGMDTTTIARGGALCLIHQQFTFREARADVRDIPEYERAEQMLRTRLWPRGVALHTGEINLATAFVRAWAAGAGESNVVAQRAERLSVGDPHTYEQMLLCAYPEAIRVAHVLTTLRLITPLLNITTSALTQAGLLSQMVAKAIGASVNDELHAFTIAVVGHAHQAMIYMYGLRTRRQAKYQLCPLNRALIVAAHRRRACLLRHANPRALPDICGEPTDAATRTRVIRNWPILIDELAMP